MAGIRKHYKKLALFLGLLILFLLAWAPWLDEQTIHDKVLQEKGRKDGTIQPLENIVGGIEALQELQEESRKKGIVDGVLICDYKVTWAPFGRWVASCEGGYFVTFYGGIV